MRRRLTFHFLPRKFSGLYSTRSQAQYNQWLLIDWVSTKYIAFTFSTAGYVLLYGVVSVFLSKLRFDQRSSVLATSALLTVLGLDFDFEVAELLPPLHHARLDIISRASWIHKSRLCWSVHRCYEFRSPKKLQPTTNGGTDGFTASGFPGKSDWNRGGGCCGCHWD